MYRQGNMVVRNTGVNVHIEQSAEAGAIKSIKEEHSLSCLFGIYSAVEWGGGKLGWMQIQKRVRRAYILVTQITYRELE